MRKTVIICTTILSLFIPQKLLSQTSFHDFTVVDIDGDEFDLGLLKGKKVLVVNTASKCGLTPQYRDLEKLYKKYGDEKFVIIGFPCNDFAQQEPGTNEEIASFCQSTYNVSFPMMSKISVKGSNMHPLYRWLTTASENGLEDSKVAWNFHKYLINEDGSLAGNIPPRKKPGCSEITSWLNDD